MPFLANMCVFMQTWQPTIFESCLDNVEHFDRMDFNKLFACLASWFQHSGFWLSAVSQPVRALVPPPWNLKFYFSLFNDKRNVFVKEMEIFCQSNTFENFINANISHFPFKMFFECSFFASFFLWWCMCMHLLPFTYTEKIWLHWKRTEEQQNSTGANT